MEINRNCTDNQGPERGIALISVMIFLLIMTIIGAAAMQSSTLQQWMSGNTTDQSLSFQAAEDGLRQGEAWLATGGWNPPPPAPQTLFPTIQQVNCPGQPCNVVWPLDFAAAVVDSYAQYTSESFWEVIAGNVSQPKPNIWVGTAVPGTTTPPYLVIENVQFMRSTLGSWKWSSDPVGGQLYRVTARGTGRSLSAHSVTQSTYMIGQ